MNIEDLISVVDGPPLKTRDSQILRYLNNPEKLTLQEFYEFETGQRPTSVPNEFLGRDPATGGRVQTAAEREAEALILKKFGRPPSKKPVAAAKAKKFDPTSSVLRKEVERREHIAILDLKRRVLQASNMEVGVRRKFPTVRMLVEMPEEEFIQTLQRMTKDNTPPKIYNRLGWIQDKRNSLREASDTRFEVPRKKVQEEPFVLNPPRRIHSDPHIAVIQNDLRMRAKGRTPEGVKGNPVDLIISKLESVERQHRDLSPKKATAWIREGVEELSRLIPTETREWTELLQRAPRLSLSWLKSLYHQLEMNSSGVDVPGSAGQMSREAIDAFRARRLPEALLRSKIAGVMSLGKGKTSDAQRVNLEQQLDRLLDEGQRYGDLKGAVPTVSEVMRSPGGGKTGHDEDFYSVATSSEPDPVRERAEALKDEFRRRRLPILKEERKSDLVEKGVILDPAVTERKAIMQALGQDARSGSVGFIGMKKALAESQKNPRKVEQLMRLLLRVR